MKSYFYKISQALVYCLINCLMIGQLLAQDFDNYQVLRASGKIPEDFTKASSEKYQEQKQKNSSNGDKFAQKVADDFYLRSSFGISDLLLSGKVLFGDPATIYVNKVADALLSGNPELRKQLRFYVIKSAAVNAFATNEGVICVNLGLLARLENEAQLAYILGHEITHYLKKHSVEGYIYSQSIKKGRGDFKDKNTYDKRLANSNYSKELEIEADKEGLSCYSKTKYDLNEAINSFEVLKNAMKPYQNLVFDKKFLENNYLTFPEKYFDADTLITIEQDTTEEAKKEAKEAELFSSHPAPEERKAKIVEAVKNPVKGELYLVSKEEFEKVRTLARFDLCDMFIIRSNFIDALYQCLLLKKEYPNSKYLDICMAKSLYGIAKYQNHSQKVFLVLNYEEVDWKGKNWFYALEEMTTRELNVLAATYLYGMKKKYANDEYLTKSLEDLLGEMSYILDFSVEKTVNDTTKNGAIADSSKTNSNNTVNIETNKISKTQNKTKIFISDFRKDSTKISLKDKYSTIKKDSLSNNDTVKIADLLKKARKKDIGSNAKAADEIRPRRLSEAMKAAVDSAWSQLKRDVVFVELFETSAKKAKESKKKNRLASSYEKELEAALEQRKKDRQGHRLGIDKVIILNPYALRYDITQESDTKKYLESEVMQTQLTDYLTESSKKLGLNAVLLNSKELSKEPNANILTQISLIREWYAEQTQHSMSAVNSRQLDVDAVIKEFGTPYIAFMGVISLKDEKDIAEYWKIIPGLICPPLIHQALRANEKTLIYTFVFDIKNEKILMEEYNVMRFKTTEAILKQNVYYHLFQIKTQNEKPYTEKDEE